jgi:hypothetical protein
MDLAVGIANINIVVIDQGDIADTAACSRFRGPGTDAANPDDAEMGFLQLFEGTETIYSGQAIESLEVVLVQHCSFWKKLVGGVYWSTLQLSLQ